MGATVSSLTSAVTGSDDEYHVDKSISGAYDAVMRNEHVRGGYSGGYDGACGCDSEPKKLGGNDGMDISDVSEYANSLNSKAKHRIVDSVLEAAGKLGLKTDGADTSTRIKNFIASIPAGNKFKQDDALQAKTCAQIARAINSAYGSKVIDETLPAGVLCGHIAEMMSSLTTGTHTEFLAVYNDVQRVLKNLGILSEQLTLNMNQMKDKIAQSDDAVVRRNLQTNYDLSEMLLNEVAHQSQLLGNMLNIKLMPTANELSNLLKNGKDVFGVISKIDLKPGSEGFGRVISDTLKGMGLTANFALIIEKALKEVGMSMQEYKALKNVDQLKSAVVSKGMHLSDDKLHEFNEALELLEKNLYRRQDIGTSISGGGSQNMKSGQYSTDEFTGGADNYPSSTMDKRVKDRTKLRNLIFQTFYRQLNDVLDRFVGALDVLSMKIGKEIPLSDQLDGFRQALGRVQVDLARRKQMYYALIGYYNDAMSRSKRDHVLGEMRLIGSYVDSILEMPQYRASAGSFQAVAAQIKAFLDLIEKYSEEIAAKFGRGEIEPMGPPAASMLGDATGTVRGGAGAYEDGRSGGASLIGDALARGGGGVDIGAVTPNSAYADPSLFMHGGATMIGDIQDAVEHTGGAGAYEDGRSGGVDDGVEPPRYRTTKTIPDAIRQFDYKYRVAQITANLNRSGKELSHYSEKYDKLTAASLAELLSEEQRMYNGLAKKLSEEKDTTTLSADERTAAKKFLDSQWEAKKKFWATVEAMDTYMRLFTNGFINNPNDIKDIRASLDDIDTIRDWYTETTGNQVAAVFDHFPNTPGAKLSKNLMSQDGSAHYYTVVEAANAAGEKPGDPQNMTASSTGVAARDSLKRALTNMTALKNLLSIFVHIGNKFGGNELKVFLTPAQIYNNLMEYLTASAVAQGTGMSKLSFDAKGDFSSTTVGTEWNNTNATPNVDGTNPLTQATLALKHWGVSMRTVTGGATDQESGLKFHREDEYFVLMLKSIAAKILTVTGMYDVIDRPYEFNGITPIRMIMGGNVDTPKVEDGAVALYLRLPLLCQFWREIFNFDEDDQNKASYSWSNYDGIPLNGNSALKISMVPDIDGTFSGLIRLVFRKTKYLDTSSYSDDDIKEIVRECNSVYQKMAVKHPQNTVMETIYELIAEVNRRYGIVTKEDRNKYVAEFGYRYDYSTGNNDSSDRYSQDPSAGDIAILPGEDEDEIQRPSGAERLLQGTDFALSEEGKKSRFAITSQHKQLIYRFRCAIDKYFENPTEEYSFNGAIKSTQSKLRRETRDEERFKIVAALVRGVDIYSKVDGLKYLMFHETVITGLNVLSGVHTMLARFQQRAQLLNFPWLIDQTVAYLDSMKGGAVNLAGLNTHLVAALKGTKVAISDTEAKTLVSNLLGEEEADMCSTGRNGTAGTLRPSADMSIPDVPKFESGTVSATGDISTNIGVSSLLNGLNVADLKTLLGNAKPTGADVDKKQRVMGFFRYLFNREYMMKELLESLFGLGQDLQGLVETRIDDGKLYMNAGGLKSLITEVFDHVGYFVEIMRAHVHPDVYSKYTDKLYAGSLYWLQEQLLEKIIVGRSAQPGSPATGYNNLDDQMRGLSATYVWLTQEYDFNGSGLSASGMSKIVAGVSRNSFDKVFAQLIFYDGERPQSGIAASLDAPEVDATTGATSKPQIVSYMTDPYEALHLSGAPGGQILDTRFAARFYQLYSWKDELTLNRSALFIFNQLVAKLIQAFYDPATKKIYSGLLSQLANGTFNRALTDLRYTYPDVAPMIAQGYTGPEDFKARPLLATGDITIGNNPVTGSYNDILNRLNAWIAGAADRGKLDAATALNDLKVALAVPAAPGWYIHYGFDVLEEAIKIYPYRSDPVGQTTADRETRLTMFRDIIVRLANDLGNAPNVNAARDAVQRIAASLASRSVHSNGRSTGAKYTLKFDDLLNLNTSLAAESDLSAPLYDGMVLLFARNEQVTNGPAASSTSILGVAGTAGKSDDFANITKFGNRADPDGDHVLFTSLAVIIRNLVSTRTANNQAVVYLHENVADVPAYMKEKMRANLPVFKNLFRELVNRCDFLKKVMMRREVSVERKWGSGVQEPAHNPWPWVLQKPSTAATSELAKDRFSSILDTITRGSQTLITSCEQSLKEIGDDPKYFETYQNSIRDYKAQYGVEPLMPLSSTLTCLANVDAKEPLNFFPQHSLGEREFKWMYGTRGLIQNMTAQVTVEATPGWTQTIESFNMMVDSRLQVDRSHADGFLKTIVKTLRWLYELKHIKGVTTSHVTDDCVNKQFVSKAYADTHFSQGSFVRGNLVEDGKTQLTNKSPVSLTSTKTDLKHVQSVFALRNPFTRVIALTESSNKDDQLKSLVDYVSGDVDGKRNNSLAVQNIIDLNIIPINVHALMREVPLANLYNYAYTYDRMVIELYYGLQDKTAMKMIRSLCAGGNPADSISNITSPKDMMVALLMNPYLDVQGAGANANLDIDSRSYSEYVQGMLLGATGDEALGRPKFLSDQIYGKVVFGELYGSDSDVSALGPSVRYSRKLTRTGLAGPLATILKDVITIATANGAMFTRATQAVGMGAFADVLANIILDDQTASISSLVKRISSYTTELSAVENSGTPSIRSEFVYSCAVLLKAVGVAFLWAATQVAKNPGAMVAAGAMATTIRTQMTQLIDLVKKVSAVKADGSLIIADNFMDDLAHAQLKPAQHLFATLKAATGAPSGLIANAGGAVAGSLNPAAALVNLENSLKTNTSGDMYAKTTSGDTKSLHYLVDGQLKSAAAPDGLKDIGTSRFDTVLVRNLIFLVNLYRSIRMKLQKDLVYSHDIVTRSIPITRQQLTEFNGNAGWKPRIASNGSTRFE